MVKVRPQKLFDIRIRAYHRKCRPNECRTSDAMPAHARAVDEKQRG
jgi:hypothetical protein